MTAQRQERNRRWPGIRVRPRIALIAVLAGLWSVSPGDLAGGGLAARAATTERVVANRFTGLAIEGYDPVAYFADARPMVGRAGVRGVARPASSGAFATRATARPLSPIPTFTVPSSAATTRSIWRGG